MSTLKRIDPSGCGCTDCLTGYSRPLDAASAGEVLAMLQGHLIDATSTTFTVTLTIEPKHGQACPAIKVETEIDSDRNNIVPLGSAILRLQHKAQAEAVIAT